MLLLVQVLALLGCTGDGASSDDTDTATDSGAGDTDSGETDVTGETDGTCDGYSAGASVAFDPIYSGTVDSEVYTSTVDAHLFETDADWQTFLAGLTVEGEVAAVDFATHRVAAGFVVVPSTCGLTVGDVLVTQATGEAVHIDFTVTDTSGACDTACSAVGQAFVAVAVARDGAGEPSVCVRRDDAGCE